MIVNLWTGLVKEELPGFHVCVALGGKPDVGVHCKKFTYAGPINKHMILTHNLWTRDIDVACFYEPNPQRGPVRVYPVMCRTLNKNSVEIDFGAPWQGTIIITA